MSSEMPYVTKAEYERLQAAEETCWSMMLAIGFGMLERAPLYTRRFITHGGLQSWAKQCADQGLMRREDADA